MGLERGISFVPLFLFLHLFIHGGVGVEIWPLPESASNGHHTLVIGNDFKLNTHYSDSSSILSDAFSRLLNLIQAPHVVEANISLFHHSLILQGITVVVSSNNEELQYGIDESYKLSVPSPGRNQFTLILRVIDVPLVPWTIIDQPRFSYRGLLIDTSRHYLPLLVIKHVIDSMTYSKLNVLHWHIVDTQSFPLEIPSYPKLWNGAYSATERYTIEDAKEIVSYAQRRGINVLPEIDVPGHALSWGVGYPSLWPSKTCQQPLDVSNEFTFKVIDGILSDFSKIFKFKFVHLGGDEVDTSCWTLTPRIKNWEETFNDFGNKLSRKTVVHNWLGGGVAQKVVESGLRCIVSNQDKWYLDHLDTTWQQFYMNEPLANITNPKQQKLVLGGEVCMWGERIDGSDIDQTIWPRAAAAAERLWTPYDNLAKDARTVAGRLSHFRCLLNLRGVAAAPLAGPGRGAPEEPGSCYLQ
ncbi:hypothetical protein FNV43_RR03644 [Rhamnella rubrinervis]|uniref:beta-N-acetylhexosaminidase n=1 Tax=Rhamnella rubrinervis TaxID=2594499 RepID=A0A8K0HIT9_9ROSA|nr:hypothetical protein FNV43_RR03644 [Rhamnella rubrinervis]